MLFAVSQRQAVGKAHVGQQHTGDLGGRVADAVKRRLKEDPAFLDLVAPLLLAWDVPPRIERKPRPEGELERDWAKFVKRTGFPLRPQDPPAPAAPPEPPKPRRRSWRRWLAVVVLGIAGVAAITVFARRRAEVAIESTSRLVPYQSGWITLDSGIEVQLTPGAALRVADRRLLGMRHLLLEGSARFRIPDIDSAVVSMRTQSLVVETPVGFVTASESEFSISTRADTTEVHVHALPGRGAIPPTPMTLAAVLELVDVDQLLVLLEPGSARLVRGRNPVRLPSSR